MEEVNLPKSWFFCDVICLCWIQFSKLFLFSTDSFLGMPQKTLQFRALSINTNSFVQKLLVSWGGTQGSVTDTYTFFFLMNVCRKVKSFNMLSSMASPLVSPFDREHSPVLDTEVGSSVSCSCGMDCLFSFWVCHLWYIAFHCCELFCKLEYCLFSTDYLVSTQFQMVMSVVRLFLAF